MRVGTPGLSCSLNRTRGGEYLSLRPQTNWWWELEFTPPPTEVVWKDTPPPIHLNKKKT